MADKMEVDVPDRHGETAVEEQKPEVPAERS